MHDGGDLRFLDALHAIGALLHHAAHADRHVRVFLELRRIRRAFFGEGPEGADKAKHDFNQHDKGALDPKEKP